MVGHLRRIYEKLFAEFGPQHWWPGETPFEVVVGAILTQNTNWGNVEKAIANLRTAGRLTPSGLKKIPLVELAALIKPSGYFYVKAKRLKNFIDFLFREYRGDLNRMKEEPLDVLRKKILSVNGIGPETADSILLYALGKTVFVIDAYTKRVLSRHALVDHETEYQNIQKIFMENLPNDRKLFNEYHALIVKLGKDFCRPKARCEDCPLNKIHYSLERRCRRCYRYLSRRQNRYSIEIEDDRIPQKQFSGKKTAKIIDLCPKCYRDQFSVSDPPTAKIY